MDDDDRKSTIDVYSGLLKTHGIDHSMGLGWSSKATQEIRFKVLAEIAALDGCSILDIGCGVGDLYSYLEKRGVEVKYHGVDVCPQMIAAARKKHPRGEYIQSDLDALDIGATFDYVLISGTFNWIISDNEGVAKRGLLKAWRMCRRGVAVNFLSARDPWKAEYLFYFNPDEIKAYAQGFAPRVEMRHDYKLYDFTLYLYKDAAPSTQHSAPPKGGYR